jgi:hypothetical protein
MNMSGILSWVGIDERREKFQNSFVYYGRLLDLGGEWGVGSGKFCRECTNYRNSNTEIPNSNISMYTKNSAELEDGIFATNARI